tara:strand:+ start:2703 stop:2951 length:249 start_codon:yes stop_codon:yes gene_type:complete
LEATTTGSLALAWESIIADTAQATVSGLAKIELAEKRIFEFLLKWAFFTEALKQYKSQQRLSQSLQRLRRKPSAFKEKAFSI